MNTKINQVFITLLICSSFLFGQKGLPFIINLDCQNLPEKYGNISINLEIAPQFKCDIVKVNIQTFGNIDMQHSKSWEESFSNKEIAEFHFDVSVPDNDTTGFEVKVQSGEIWHHAYLYFVSTGDNLKVFKGNPRYETKLPNTEMKIKIEGDKGEKLPSELPNYQLNKIFREPINTKDSNFQEIIKIDTLSKQTIQSFKTNFEVENNILKPNKVPFEKIILPIKENNSSINENNNIAKVAKVETSIPQNKYLLSNSRYSVTSTTIFSESFSGSYPGSWSIGHDGGDGSYAWAWPVGTSNYAHCYAQSGGSSYYYPNNLHVFMERRNVSLSGYSEATFTFSKIVDTESGYDKFTVNVRDQSGSWHTMYVESGITDPLSWSSKSLNFDQFAGQTGLYIQFRFDSDGSTSGSPYSGVFLDNITLSAEAAPQKPNLTYYKPSGWSYPIVPSSISGTNTVSTLIADQNTYIDWAIENEGPANITTSFYTALFIDNNYVTRWSTSSILANYWAGVEDYTRSLSEGTHTLKIITDYYDDIDETDENDNEYSRSFYWEPSTKPNLIPYAPSGWDYPTVPSSVTGTNVVNTLYADQITYIDWCVKNTGDENAGQFQTALYIDNNLIESWTHTTGLQENYISKIEDYEPPLTLSEGNHTIKIVTDYLNEISESNENDNEYSRQFYWEGAGAVIVEGWLRYRDLNNAWPNARDMRNVRIELWDDDVTSGDDLLVTGKTDNTGHFSLGPVTNNETLQGRLDIYIKAFAQNEACTVNESHNGDTYFIQTDVVNNVPNGPYDYGTLITTDEQSGSFFIADRILDGFNKWNSIMQSNNPGSVQLVWNENVGTHYTPSEQTLYIEAVNDPAKWYPDTFDKSVIIHEYGHRLEDRFDFFDGGGGDHFWSTSHTLELASSEGWATFWSNVTLSTPGYFDRYNNFEDYWYSNSENGKFGSNVNNLTKSANNNGNRCEGAVCGMYWDLYDNVDDDYDNDGIGDNYNGSLNDILNVLVNRNVNNHHPDHSDDFFEAWSADPAMSTALEIGEIWFEHGDQNLGLPVELTTFSASTKDCSIQLNWETATEVNNYGFNVERKTEISDWQKITFVDGHGNSNSPKFYSFVDSKPFGGSKFIYRLKQIDIDGEFEYSDEIEVIVLPNKNELYQNYPNPFNPTTTIRFSLIEAQNVKIKIYNIMGEEVYSLIDEKYDTGYHELKFDGSQFSSGIYFCSIQTSNFTSVRKIMLMK